MNPARLRLGEWAAALAATGFVVTLFLDWFDRASAPPVVADRVTPQDPVLGIVQAGVSGWEALGAPWIVLALLPVLLTVLTVVTTAAARPVAWEVYSGMVLTATTILVTPLLALRVLVLQPGDNGTTDVTTGAYLGLLCLVLLGVAAWRAMADERKDAPHTAFTPPPPRPLPEA